MNTTRENIMGVAERLFAEQGIGGTSLRSIMEAADVNAAAIAYHFGSKEDLIREILKRRLGPINDERLKRLDQLEAQSRNRPLSASQILEAFLEPPLRLATDKTPGGEFFIQFLGRIFVEAGEDFQPLLQEHFGEILRRFPVALKRSLPEVSRAELSWRFFFMLGAFAYTMMNRSLVTWISGGRCNPNDTKTVLRQLVAFANAGLTGPNLSRIKKRTRK